MKTDKEINDWCKRMERCTYRDTDNFDSDEISLSAVNKLCHEFANNFNDWEKAQIIAWCCGQLTGHRIKIRKLHEKYAEAVKE